MSDESARYKEIERADRAAEALRNPLIGEALDLIEHDYFEAWLACPARDVDFREKCWSMCVAARKFRNTLQSVVETGQMAKIQLEDSRKFRLFVGR